MRLLALALLATTITVQAETPKETSVTFGGWSKHTKLELGDYSLNENHKGLGIRHYMESKTKHSYGAEFWYMKDSHGNPARHYGVNYRYTVNDRLSLTLSGMYMDRTFRRDYVVSRKQLFAIAPYATVKIYKSLSVDFSYMPKLKSETGVFFIRGSYKF